jgi:hypothetical protein
LNVGRCRVCGECRGCLPDLRAVACKSVHHDRYWLI